LLFLERLYDVKCQGLQMIENIDSMQHLKVMALIAQTFIISSNVVIIV